MPDRRGGQRASAAPALQEEVKRVLLARFTPPSFLIDDAFSILHVQGRPAPFLLSEPGTPAVNLLRLLKESLAVVVRAAVLTAKSEDRSVSRATALAAGGEEYAIVVDVLAVRSDAERRRRYLVVLTTDAAPSGAAPGQLTFADARSKAAPAAGARAPGGEELAAAKRELQAANEELVSVNAELRERNRAASATNDDLTNLLTSVEIPIIMLDLEMRVRRVTPQADHGFGVGFADIGRSIASLKLAVDIPGLQELVGTVLAGFGPRHLEVRDRKGRWFSLWVRPYRTTSHAIAGAVLSLMDVTERKNGIRQLELSRDYAEAIVDAVNTPLLILNRHLKVVRASRSYYTSFRAEPAEVEGRSIYELDRGWWNVPAVRRSLASHATGLAPFSNLELELAVPNLGRRTLAISGRVVPHESENGGSIVMAIEDVSLRKEAAEAAALRKSEARQRSFVANVSHELMTPITAIKGYAESLIGGALDVPVQRVKFTQTIERHADRLAQLVEDILQLSAQDDGRPLAAAESVPLRASIDKLVRGMAPVSRKRGVTIKVRVPKTMRVAMNRAELSQVMQNLCENAIKYNRRNGSVSIVARVVGRRAVVSVRDTGIGIPKEDLPRIFDRFHRAENARRNTERGSGLGLSIVRSILVNRGCRIWAESDLGKGSTIMFTLPLVEKPRRRRRPVT